MLMILARLVRSESFWAVAKVRSPHTGPGRGRGPPQRLVVRPSGPLILRLISQHFRGENHPLELHEP